MSGDLVRLQGYLSSHLISYSVHDPGWFSGSCGQFSDWFTSGCAAWFLGVIIAVSQPTTSDMSTATAIINGNTVEADIATLTAMITLLQHYTDTMTGNDEEEIDPIEEELIPFNEFTVKELTPHFGNNLAHEIVDKLEECRTHFSGFQNFIGMYRKCSTIEQRQLLKTVSAVYRFKFADLGQKYTLKSQIKWDTMCPHCGAFANAFVVRLTKEGLWTV